jgi:hypothetical protein
MPQRFPIAPSNMPKNKGSTYKGAALEKDNRARGLPAADNSDKLSNQRKYPLHGLLRQAN